MSEGLKERERERERENERMLKLSMLKDVV